MKNHIHTFKVVCVILLFALINLLVSCGARQAEKKRLEERSKMETTDKSKTDKLENLESNIKKLETIVVNDQDQTTIVEETIEPLDASKPASYTDKKGNKQELNNAKKTTKTTVKNNNKKTEATAKTDALVKSNKKEAEQKNIEAKEDTSKKGEEIKVKRKAWSLWNFAWLLLIIPIFLIWKYRSNILSKIWWI